jgi:hypothetical protein
MFKHILAGADINWMAIFALITFFSLFTIAVIAIFATDKKYLNKMANLPLEEETTDGNRE